MKDNKINNPKVIVDENGVHDEDESVRHKIILISIVVLIFVFSIGLIAWVVMKENYYRKEEVQVLRYPKKSTDLFMAQNENQRYLMRIKSEIENIEADIEEFNEVLNDTEADEYGKLLVNQD